MTQQTAPRRLAIRQCRKAEAAAWAPDADVEEADKMENNEKVMELKKKLINGEMTLEEYNSSLREHENAIEEQPESAVESN